MDYATGGNAFAVWTGSEWVLKPICDPGGLGPGRNGVAIRDGAGWLLAPMVKFEAPENAFTVRDAAGDPVLWPIRCPEADDSAAPGPHPYCSVCPDTAPLRSSYTVSLSDMPSICGVQYFNGAHTVTRVGDCEWACQVDATRRVTLNILSRWTLAWRDTAPGGPSGDFDASGATQCRPETAAWSPDQCFEPFGCWGLRTQYLAYASCIIT